MRDAFATVELIYSFLDCRKKFDLLGDLLQRDFIWQLTNHVQHNFFLAHVDEYARALQANQTARSALIVAWRFLASSVVGFSQVDRSSCRIGFRDIAAYFSFAGNLETWRRPNANGRRLHECIGKLKLEIEQFRMTMDDRPRRPDFCCG
jgi:hypothetical protein